MCPRKNLEELQYFKYYSGLFVGDAWVCIVRHVTEDVCHCVINYCI